VSPQYLPYAATLCFHGNILFEPCISVQQYKELAEANDLKGVIDVADFNDGDKLGKGRVQYTSTSTAAF